jgi:hypothetical protein
MNSAAQMKAIRCFIGWSPYTHNAPYGRRSPDHEALSVSHDRPMTEGVCHLGVVILSLVSILAKRCAGQIARP